MVFKYKITVPLIYNKFDVHLKKSDSELCYKIEQGCEEKFEVGFITYEVPGHKEGIQFDDTVKVRIHSDIHMKDDYQLICEIDGMLFDDEIYARKFSEDIVDRICKRISFVFIKHNANRHLYQPRVEALWNKAIFSCAEYEPFVNAKRKAREKFVDNDKKLYFEDKVYIHDSVYISSQITIPVKKIKIKEWMAKQDDVVEFLMDEYYSALGAERIKSKFFHLFTIIEFCEKEFEEHSGSHRLLTDEEVDALIELVENAVDKKIQNKIVSLLGNDLKKVNDIGRVGKLENILKWMGIEKYQQFGCDILVDKKLLLDITKLRNKSFHGTKENTQEVEAKYAHAVVALLYIDEMIIDFLMQNSNNVVDSFLLRGKEN